MLDENMRLAVPLINRAKRMLVRTVLFPWLRAFLATPAGVAAFNSFYGRLPLDQKRRLFFVCAESHFRVEGKWNVDFAGRRLTLPLHRDFAPAWSLALAFEGHDTELHQFYETLIRTARPRVMFDVGASYGLHSVRFLSHGVRTVSFEPNTACHAYLRDCGVVNGLEPEIHGVAVAESAGCVEFAVPEDETYLGTIVQGVIDRWRARSDVTTATVSQVSLDDFVADSGLVPDFVKIDVEGSEIGVLRGAQRLLATVRPLVVFESWRASDQRKVIFERLTSCGYVIRALTYPYRKTPVLSLGSFCRAPASTT